MGKKYTEEVPQVEEVRELPSPERLVHLEEGCIGKFVVEFTDHLGAHQHCPSCGAWFIATESGK